MALNTLHPNNRPIFLGVYVLLSFISFFGKGQNLYISGGNKHSAAICANGQVLSWGDNGQGQLGLKPDGTAYSETQSSSPRISNLANGMALIGVKQVDAGSGAHTLALACDNTVYAWGSNVAGQLGSGVAGGFSATPIHVLKGATPSSSLYLENVKYVSGGNEESYAILEGAPGQIGGDLVTWGQNNVGQLGNGSTAPSLPTPVYVMKTGGGKLTNVIQVEGGDETGYALTADGTVWSWGGNTNKALGRAPTAAESASPVVKSDGSPLTNIVQLSGGDKHGLAVDKNGNVWSWGGDWGPGQAGLGTGAQENGFASKVLAPGNCIPNSPPYLVASTNPGSIAAGQAHSMAVLPNGEMVTWGANVFYNASAGTDPGGQLGQNSTSTTVLGVECPGYVVSSGSRLKGIQSVSDGDAWSFAVSNTGQIYVMGFNQYGQLGIPGSTSPMPSAVPMTLPGCDFAIPCPKPNIGANLNLCPRFSRELYAGVDNSKYRYTWYFNDTLPTSIVKAPETGIGAAKGAYYIAKDKFGKYIVKVVNIQATQCIKCEIGLDTITIDSIIPPPVPKATYCKNEITPAYGHADIKNKKFIWGTDQDSTSVNFVWLGGKAINPPSFTFTPGPPSNITNIGNDANGKPKYKIYAFSKDTVYSKAGPKTPPCTGSDVNVNSFSQAFTAYKSFTIDTLTFTTKFNDNYPAGGFTSNVFIYESNPVTTVPKPNPTYTIPYSLSATEYDQGDFKSYTIKVNQKIPAPTLASGKQYWIGLQNYNGVLTVYKNCVGVNGPYSDIETNGQLLSIAGGNFDNSAGNAADPAKDFGAFYNWRLSSLSLYPCGGIQVDITESCPPCQKPTSFKIEKSADSICSIPASNVIKLSVKDTLPATPADDPKFYVYQWYKAATATGPATILTGENKNTLNVTTAAAYGTGKYVVRVGHTSTTNNACFLADSVNLRFDIPFTNNTVTPFDTICLGSAAKIKEGSTPSKGAAKPTGGFVEPIYTWQSFSTSGSYNPVGGNTKDFDPGIPSAAGPISFYRRLVSGGICKPSISDSAGLLIIETPFPGAINSDQQICENGKPVLTNKTASSSGTYSWVSSLTKVGNYKLVAGSGNTADLSNPPSATGTIYYRRVSTDGKCSDTTAAVTITTISGMNPGTIGSDETICYNQVPKPISGPSATGGTGLNNGVAVTLGYQWFSSTVNDPKSFTSIPGANSASYSPPKLTDTTYYLRQSFNGGTKCDTSVTSVVAVTVLPQLLGGAISPKDTFICANQSIKIKNVKPASGGKGAPYVYRWEISTDAGANWIPATNTKDTIGFNTGSLTQTTYFRRVVQGTPCDTALSNVQKVFVTPVKKPFIAIVDPGTLCNGSPIVIRATAKDTGSAPVYTWKLKGELLSKDTTAPAIDRFWPAGNQELLLSVKGGPGCYKSADTSVKFTVVEGIIPGVIDSVINICAGDPDKTIASLTKAEGGTLRPATPKYQWQQSTTGLDASWTDITTGVYDADVYTPKVLPGTKMYFRRKATNGSSTCDVGVTKHVVYTRSTTITGGKIGPIPLNPICGNLIPAPFTSIVDPQNGTPNDLTRFTFKWYRSVNKNTGYKVEPTTSTDGVAYAPTAELTESKDTVTYYYYREAKEKCGTAYSDTLALKVYPVLKPHFNYLPLGTICMLDKQPVTVKPTNVGATPTYQWFLNGSTTAEVGQNSSTYTNTIDWVPPTATLKLTMTPSSDVCTNGAVDTIINLDIQDKVMPAVNLSETPTFCGDHLGSPYMLQFLASPIGGGGNAPQYAFFKKNKSGGPRILLQDYSVRDTLIGTYPNTTDTIGFVDGDSIIVIMKSNSSCRTKDLSNEEKHIIRIVPTPVAIVDEPRDTCTPYTITMTAKGALSNTTYKWFKNNSEINNEVSPTYVQIEPGTFNYKAVLTNTNYGLGCSDTSNMVTAFLEYLFVDAGPETDVDFQEMVPGSPVTLKGKRSPMYEIEWTPNEFSGDTTLTFPDDSLNPLANPGKSQWYVLSMVSPVTGCKSKDSTLVKVLSPIKIPNVFTPNGDKLNDVWEIENIDNFPDNVVRVFNRWGNVVYEKGGYTNATGWNGTTSSGGELPVAVYYFVIDPKHPKGGGVHAGYVTVLK